jgi:hypothetical protein
MPTCSHELFRLLIQNVSAAEKRTAVVLEDGAPIAVVALRRRKYAWESVCAGVVPGSYAPVAPGRLWDAIAALRVFVWINGWGDPVPAHSNVHAVEHLPNFRVSTSTDFDKFWAARGNTSSIKKAAARCSKLGGRMELEIDNPAALSWIVDGWARNWAGHAWAEHLLAPDILLAGEYLRIRGAYRTFRLLHDGRPVAGFTAVADDETLTMQHSARDPAYDRARVGVRLDELFFRWSASSPYAMIDLGGALDYKAKWGDADITRARFIVSPVHLVVLRSMVYTAYDIAGRMSDLGHNFGSRFFRGASEPHDGR